MKPIHRPLALLILLVFLTATALAAPKPDPTLLARAATFEPIFYAPATSTVALSPDGTKVAFDRRRGDQLSIITLDLERPTLPIAEIVVGSDELATHRGSSNTGLGWIHALHWIDNERLMVASNIRNTSGRGGTVVFAFDADGGNARTLLNGPEEQLSFGILSFLEDPTPRLVCVATAPNWREWRVIELTTGRTNKITREKSDAYTELTQALEAQLNLVPPEADLDLAFLRETLPDYTLTLFPPRGASSRRVAKVERADRPGRFIAFDATARRIWDLAGGAPPGSARRIEFHAFDFDENGESYRGFVATPVYSPTERAPVILWMQTAATESANRRYEPTIRAFNEMGFAVVVLLPRNSDAPITAFNFNRTGVGRISAPDLKANRPSISDVVARERQERNPTLEHASPEIQHQLRALDLVAERYVLSHRAVALFADHGESRRALLLNAYAPGRFRCLVFHNMRQANVRMEGEGEWLKVIRKSADYQGTSALFTLVDRNTKAYGDVGRIITKLKSCGIQCERLPLPGSELIPEHPADYALTIARIERFLNENLYAYATEIGDLHVLPDSPPEP